MTNPTPADRMALAMCKFSGQCEAACSWCRQGMWLKGNPLQDAQKAAWYLNRLISHLERNA